ncbi:MAG: hypothetical protein HY778_14380 [Betaproteobacteria bacterium]|nr:hypothetical protein [Betaproteobacteria bacterium]
MAVVRSALSLREPVLPPAQRSVPQAGRVYSMSHHRPARADGFIFYALAVTAQLQGTAPIHARNLASLFCDDDEVCDWLHETWLPEERAHAAQIQDYIVRLWPDFRWQESYTRFLHAFRDRRCGTIAAQRAGLSALGCCLMEAEVALMFRVLSAYTADPELKRLMLSISAAKLRHYNFYRDALGRLEKRSPSSALHKALTVLRCQKAVEDGDIALAFRPLNAHWGRNAPFRMMDYPTFLACAGKVMGHFYPFDEARRLLVDPLRRQGPLSALFVALALRYVERLYVARGRLAPSGFL